MTEAMLEDRDNRVTRAIAAALAEHRERAAEARREAREAEANVARITKAGHFHRMRIHGYIERRLVNGPHGSTWAWCLTNEGKLRAFPEHGTLRITAERYRRVLLEGQLGAVYKKNRYSLTALRNAWYTPDYAKTIPKPEPKETPEKRLVKALRPLPLDVALGVILAITAPPPDELLDVDDFGFERTNGNRFTRDDE